MAKRVSRCASAVPHATFDLDTSPRICEWRQSYFPCGLVAGKSLMSVAIVLENAFRPYNGQSFILQSTDECLVSLLRSAFSCGPRRKSLWPARLGKSLHEATQRADAGLSGPRSGNQKPQSSNSRSYAAGVRLAATQPHARDRALGLSPQCIPSPRSSSRRPLPGAGRGWSKRT
jgi:hypothetical protein